MNGIQLAWVAGLLEGEGSFSTSRTRSSAYPRVEINMTDEDVVRRFAELCAAPSVRRYTRPNDTTRKPVFRARIHGKASVELMRAVLPFMGARRTKRIEDVLNETSGRYE